MCPNWRMSWRTARYSNSETSRIEWLYRLLMIGDASSLIRLHRFTKVNPVCSVRTWQSYRTSRFYTVTSQHAPSSLCHVTPSNRGRPIGCRHSIASMSLYCYFVFILPYWSSIPMFLFYLFVFVCIYCFLIRCPFLFISIIINIACLSAALSIVCFVVVILPNTR